MARSTKRKAAEISAFATAVDQKQENSKSGKKKQKTEGNQSASTSRLTRSASNTMNVTDISAKPSSTTKTGRSRKASPEVPTKVAKKGTKKAAELLEEVEQPQNNVSIALPPKKTKTKAKTKKGKDVEESENEADFDGRQYWLMKAEPESRIEKGKDVKFSIDDLKASSRPEPWDGVRNLEARNNMRAMTKGDLAFFYHSNCKVPGIVGIMEIVQEHSVDESAFDQDHPYYDEKSSRENPKWHLVHVAFKQKFPDIIKLKELQKFSKEGGTLENMQATRRSRLSVSKVSKKEWDFIMSLVDTDDEVTDNVAPAKGSGETKTNGVSDIHPKTDGQKEDDRAETTTDPIKSKEGNEVANSNGEAAATAEVLDSAITT